MLRLWSERDDHAKARRRYEKKVFRAETRRRGEEEEQEKRG
jgi:hypothetical protein